MCSIEKQYSFRRCIRLAGAYAACAIGSGFATGQEILQFFTAHGLMSFSGILLTTLIFSRCGAGFMAQGYEFALSSPEEALGFYFGNRLKKAVSAAMQLFLFFFYVVMIAGAGAALSEYFGAPAFLGRLLMALLTLVTVLPGLSGLADILGWLGIVIIVFSLLTGALGFARDPSAVRELPRLLPQMELTRSGSSWLTAAILYPAYNAVFILPVSCCLGAEAGSRKEALVGGALGGVLFGLSILIMNLGLAANLASVGEKAVPSLAMAELISPVLALIFSLVILLGIYTTAAPLLWSLVRPFAEDGTRGSFLAAAVFSALGLLLGMADFRRLVSIIYPVSGYVGILFLLLTLLRGRRDETTR